MVPAQVAFIPVLQLFAPIRALARNFIAIWLAHTAFALPFGIFLLRNFFITLPRDLIEAARIDGASTFGVFRTIVVPLSVPAIAAYGIFQFLWVWNDLLMALVFVQNAANDPLTRQINGLLSPVRDGVASPGRVCLPADDRSADRLLQPPAVLRAGPPRRARSSRRIRIHARLAGRPGGPADLHWNIRAAIGPGEPFPPAWWRHVRRDRFERIAGIVAALDADAVLLQEVAVFNVDGELFDQPAELARLTSMSVRYAAAHAFALIEPETGRTVGSAQWGNAILSRRPLQDGFAEGLPFRG
ncbi:MAG: ABC transporter permease subunit [Candidatus Limnocylindrales bacterium]